jgi:hypothetical protein
MPYTVGVMGVMRLELQADITHVPVTASGLNAATALVTYSNVVSAAA